MIGRTPRSLALVLALGLLAPALLAGCREEGPAEKAGRQIDEALEKLREGDEGPLERAGRELGQTAERLREEAEALKDEAKRLSERAREQLEEAEKQLESL